jgi:spore germination cell wall hydrolase CwlJ-like protein
MNKLKFISLILLGYSSTTFAMWTEYKPHTHKIDVSNFKTNTEKKAEHVKKVAQIKAPKQYIIEIEFTEPAPKTKPVKQVENVPFKADITRGELAVDTRGKKIAGQSEKDVDCLAYSIFREAGTLSENAQLAVGQVHINRLREGTWGDTMCKVVYYQKQFSWTDEKIVQWSVSQRDKYVAEAKALMNGLRVKKLDSEDILHYHANYVHPKWANQGIAVAKAGPHIFYKDVPY